MTCRMSFAAILYALEFLHDDARLIHTGRSILHSARLTANSSSDIQENNVIVALEEREALEELEQSELTEPSPRKISGDRIIYESQAFAISGAKSVGRPILCDFGQACSRDMKHKHLIQPGQYRAPEVIFGMEWDEKVDIWIAGVMVRLS